MKKKMNEISGTLLSNKQMRDLKGGQVISCNKSCTVGSVSGRCKWTTLGACACTADPTGGTTKGCES